MARPSMSASIGQPAPAAELIDARGNGSKELDQTQGIKPNLSAQRPAKSLFKSFFINGTGTRQCARHHSRTPFERLPNVSHALLHYG
jgi:hypothetical protein